MRNFKIVFATLICFSLFTSCVTTGNAKSTADKAYQNEQSLLGFWNSRDMEYVAEDVIKDILATNAYNSFYQYYGREPVMCVGIFENLSGENFDTKTLTSKFNQEFKIQKLEYELIDTSDILKVRQNAESAGCDLFIAGSVKTVVENMQGKMSRRFIVTANLYDLSADRKLWTGEHNQIVKAIRKYAKLK